MIPQQLEELKQFKNWVCFQLEDDPKPDYPEHKTKIPKSPLYRGNAKSTDPSTWGTYEEAVAAVKKYGYSGIGFVFSKEAGYTGIDLDRVIENGKLNEEAEAIVNSLDSYTEYSPSKRGVHILVKAEIPKALASKDFDPIEMYDTGRFFTITGEVFGQPRPIEERQKETLLVHKHYSDLREARSQNKTRERSRSTSNKGVEDGGRNKALISYVYGLRYNNPELTADQLKQMVRERNATYKPPLSEKELQAAIFPAITSKLQNEAAATIEEDVIDYQPEPIGAYMATFEALQNERKDFIKTGILSLDIDLQGGLQDELYILGAETGQGKSALSMFIAQNIARGGNDVLYFALEMSRKEFIARGISAITFERRSQQTPYTYGNILYSRYDYKLQDFIRLSYISYSEAAAEYFTRYGKHLHIYENGNGSGITAKFIDQVTRQHYEKTGNKPVIFIDYLQMLAADPSDRGQVTSSKLKIDAAVRILKQLSIDLSIPVFTISSLNRQGYGSRVTSKSFKESGDLEYTGGVMLGLNLEAMTKSYDSPDEAAKAIKEANKSKPEQILEPRKMILEVLKFRSGAKDKDINLLYYPAFNYYEIDPLDQNKLNQAYTDFKDHKAASNDKLSEYMKKHSK
jgi:replicative DNA helicase